jgi:hypothetical protein
MTTALAQAAQAIPAYCSSGHGVLTPSQWKTCWDAGWSQPVTGAAHAGAATGHYAAPGIAIAIAIIAILFLLSKTGSSAAPQRS